MEEGDWMDFRYLGYYDFPRTILVQLPLGAILLRSYFDGEMDDYTDFYQVFKVPSMDLEELIELEKLIESGSPGERTKLLGQVPVRKVRFDPTKRKQLDLSSIMEGLGSAGTDLTRLSSKD